jgi:fermentation-respiration switch protein FrsA (DUF1100 family)
MDQTYLKGIVPSRVSSPRYWLRLAAFAIISSTVAALFLLVYFIYLQANAFVTANRTQVIGTPAEAGLTYQDVTLTTADGLKLVGWYIPGRQPEAIILVHGLDANRSALIAHAALLAEAGYPVLLFDLRGHGQSEGVEVTYGFREALDVQAAVDYLLALPGIEQVGALGTSMGGAVVARAAVEDPRLQAIVIENSYSSLAAAVDDAFDDRSIFPRWPFGPLLIALAEQRIGLKVSQIDPTHDLATLSPHPVLIIHGTEDRLFPPYHAQRMYDAAREPKELWLIEGLEHASPLTDHAAEYRDRVVGFFERAFAQGGK